MVFNIMPSLELHESTLFGVYSLIDTLNQSMLMTKAKIQPTCVTIHVSCHYLTYDSILYEHVSLVHACLQTRMHTHNTNSSSMSKHILRLIKS